MSFWKIKSFIDYKDALACSESCRPASSETQHSSLTLSGSHVSTTTSGCDLKSTRKHIRFCLDCSISTQSQLVLAHPRCFDYAISFSKIKKRGHRCTVRYLNWNMYSKNVLRRIIEFWNSGKCTTWGGSSSFYRRFLGYYMATNANLSLVAIS